MNALAANREALRLRDEQHLTYEAISVAMRAHGIAISGKRWGQRVREFTRPPAPPPLPPEGDLPFTQAYRESLRVGYDPFEALDPGFECRACGHLPCVCRRAVA